MKTLSEYISESYEPQITIILSIDEANVVDIAEANKQIWPKPGQWRPVRIITGDHVEDRKNERHVTDKDIISAVEKAKKQILALVKNGGLETWKPSWGKDTCNFVICDTETNKQYPLSVVGFVKNVDSKFKKCTVVIKTVATYRDFAALMRKDSEREKHIYIY